MSCSKSPPKFTGEEDYELWRNDVKIWCELTDLAEAKQALAIHLSLHGRARVASSEIEIDDLKKDKGVGVKMLLDKLDGIFLVEKGRRQFAAYRELYRLRRDSNCDIEEFISKFEHNYFKFKSQSGSTLPDSVVAFMLLEACNLEEKDEKLVLSGISDVKFDDVKTTLKRVFGGKFGNAAQSLSEIKEEPTFMQNLDDNSKDVLYAKSFQHRGQNFRARGRGGRFSGNRGYYGNRGGSSKVNNDKASYSPKSMTDKRSNPRDSEGNILRCHICDSKFHFARDCAHAYEKQYNKKAENDEDRLSMFVAFAKQDKSSKIQLLVEESYGCALLDSGCSTSVCGEQWLNNYLDSLSEYEKSLVKEEVSNAAFTFGDGSSCGSMKKVSLPCHIKNIAAKVTVDVVKQNIPLLLSKQAMKKSKMCLNFTDDSVTLLDQKLFLRSSLSGHYLLPLSQ